MNCIIRYRASLILKKHARKILVRKLEGKRSLGGSRNRWEDNIKIDIKETGCDGAD
jgi:hypothetical protein